MSGSPQRRVTWVIVFWALLAALLIGDWLRTAPQRDRFAEPAPWALGSGELSQGGHCTSAPGR